MHQQFPSEVDSSSIPNFGFRDLDTNSLPPPPDAALLQLVIPTEGLDTEFIWKVSQLMEVSFDRGDPVEMANLSFVVEESLRQMFLDFTRSPVEFMRLVNGSSYDPNIPGLPVQFYLKHIESLVSRWNEFVVLFREYAYKFYNVVLLWSNIPQYVNMNFTFKCLTRTGGGIVFFLSPQRVNYVI